MTRWAQRHECQARGVGEGEGGKWLCQKPTDTCHRVFREVFPATAAHWCATPATPSRASILSTSATQQHYLATLFAVHGLQQTENCDVWGVAAVDWGHGGAHPRSYA